MKKIQKQYVLFGGVLLSFGLLGFGLFKGLAPEAEKVSLKKEDARKIDHALKSVNLQERWVDSVKEETKALGIQNKVLSDTVKALQETFDKVLDPQKESQKQEEIVMLHQELGRLREDLESYKRSSPALQSPPSTSFEMPSSQDLMKPSLSSLNGEGRSSRQLVLTLKGSRKRHFVKDTAPATTFIKAVLLGGVDAVASIQAPQDPEPVPIRLLNAGSLPRGFHSDLNQCRMNVAAWGVLSSERVKMRLEKLVCVNPQTGEILETSAQGTVYGEDGKVGLRGLVVDKTGPLIRNSLLSGLLSGISGFFSASNRGSVFPVTPFGQTQAMDTKDMLKGAASQGAGNALDKMSDYFIKRAEQMQPVIQVNAGRLVDIVLSEGLSLREASERLSSKPHKPHQDEGEMS